MHFQRSNIPEHTMLRDSYESNISREISGLYGTPMKKIDTIPRLYDTTLPQENLSEYQRRRNRMIASNYQMPAGRSRIASDVRTGNNYYVDTF